MRYEEAVLGARPPRALPPPPATARGHAHVPPVPAGAQLLGRAWARLLDARPLSGAQVRGQLLPPAVAALLGGAVPLLRLHCHLQRPRDGPRLAQTAERPPVGARWTRDAACCVTLAARRDLSGCDEEPAFSGAAKERGDSRRRDSRRGDSPAARSWLMAALNSKCRCSSRLPRLAVTPGPRPVPSPSWPVALDRDRGSGRGLAGDLPGQLGLPRVGLCTRAPGGRRARLTVALPGATPAAGSR